MHHDATNTVSMRIPAGLLAAITILATLLAACGGGEEGPAPTATSTETNTRTPPVQGTPVITGNQFEYPARGYGVQMPEGWEADADYLTGPGIAVDAFFAPGEDVEGAKASIAITREDLEPSITTESYVDAKLSTIRSLAEGEPSVSQREVGGLAATAVEYQPTATDIRVEKTDVIFVQHSYGWTITLTVPAGQRGQYEEIFTAFLASFQALGE